MQHFELTYHWYLFYLGKFILLTIKNLESGNIVIDKVTSKLRRRFELTNISSDTEFLILQFKIANFLMFDQAHFTIQDDAQNQIPFSYNQTSKNTFTVKLELSYILDDSIRLNFYYNKRKLWLVAHASLKEIVELNHHIYIFKVNKKLSLTQFKTRFEVSERSRDLTITQLDNDHIKLHANTTIQALFLFNRQRQLEIPLTDNQLNLSYLQQYIKRDHYDVYVLVDNTLEKANVNGYQQVSYLTMLYEWLGNTLNISIKQLIVDQFKVNALLNDNTLRFSASLDALETLPHSDAYTFDSFAIINRDFNHLLYLPTTKHQHKVFGQVQFDQFEDTTTKKIIAVFKHQHSDRKQFYVLRNKRRVRFSGHYRFNDELYHLNIKHKAGISLIQTKPKIKMGINSITEDQLDIYFQPPTIYETFQYYITFEERESQRKFEQEIKRGEQSVDVPYTEIERLKTSSKTIIDIFISIYDGETLVRKDKIRFKRGIYKKDNYLTLKSFHSEQCHTYYMFTLTPFKNIKIESFELSTQQYQLLEQGQKDNNVWLIGERTDTAQDNGIQFFKWLRRHTSIEAYYVISEDSNDYERIKTLNHIVTFGSLAHFEVAAKANVLISTHDLENILPYKTARGFWGYEDTYKIFLQHGVLGRKKVEYDKRYYDLPFHLFNVSSTQEKYDIVVNTLGYDPDDVAITGLSRFDNLPLEPTKEIKKVLIMPTWRDWLNSDYAFNTSEYMQRYLNLIKSDDMTALLQKYDIEINFYPHYRAQHFFKYHLDHSNGQINYIALGERTVQELLIEHDILITDYSSVSFDFSYMRKPVIFFHFDVDRFFRKGILRPVNETFIGHTVYHENELIAKLEALITDNQYEAHEDLTHIFDHVDHHNNQRVHDAIIHKITNSNDVEE